MENTKLKKDIIQHIKDCGQALVDHAESIAGDYKYPCGFVITCYVDTKNEGPRIDIKTEFLPEQFVERYL